MQIRHLPLSGLALLAFLMLPQYLSAKTFSDGLILRLTNNQFSLVELDYSASTYVDLVNTKRTVDVPINWELAEGQTSTSIEFQLNGHTILSEETNGAKRGQTILSITEGGVYELSAKSCELDSCIASVNPVKFIVEDTDGSHLTALQMNILEQNVSYNNDSNAVIASYFTEWSESSKGFSVLEIPAFNLTHLIYAFVPICGANESLKRAAPNSHKMLVANCHGLPDYSVTLHDFDAAVLKKYHTETASNSYQGNFGQLMQLKQTHPELTILPSIGGWTLSDPFFDFVVAENRKTFVDSVAQFLRTWKFFDGVDIDWEYPGGSGANPDLGNSNLDGEAYVLLMQELRQMLNELQRETGREYQLTSAVGATTSKIKHVDYSQAQRFLDYIFVMSYDFYGEWDNNKLGHMTGVYAPKFRIDDKQTQKTHLLGAVDAFLAQGVASEKLVAGVAKYGRRWHDVHDFHTQEHLTGTGQVPTASVLDLSGLDYRDIANMRKQEYWQYFFDANAKAAYIVNSKTGDVISYDDPESVMAKAKLVKDKALAGLFSWEISGDNGDLLNAMHKGLGHPKKQD